MPPCLSPIDYVFGLGLGLVLSFLAITYLTGGADLAIPYALAIGGAAVACIGAAIAAALESAAFAGLYSSMASTAAMASGVGAAMGAAFAGSQGAVGSAATEILEGGAPALETGATGAAEDLTAAGADAIGEGVSSGIDHVVLGIEEYGLKETATRIGGRTLMNSTNFRADFQAAAANPATRFTLLLDGFAGDSAEFMVMNAAARGATGLFGGNTPWEAYQLYQSGQIATTTLMLGGQVVANPFAP